MAIEHSLKHLFLTPCSGPDSDRTTGQSRPRPYYVLHCCALIQFKRESVHRAQEKRHKQVSK